MRAEDRSLQGSPHGGLAEVAEHRLAFPWDKWDTLGEPLEHPFLLEDWLAPWCEAFAPRARPIASYASGSLVYAAPVFDAARGRVMHGCANVHTPISGVLASPPAEPDLASLIPADVQEVIWPSLNDQEARSLAANLSQAGWLADVEPQHRSPVVGMCDSGASYDRSRGRGLRQRAGRLRRKLEREHAAEFVFTSPSENPGLFEACLQLEALGWKGRRRTAILSDPATAMFYRAVSRTERARLAALVRPGGPLAFAFCLVHGGRLFLLKTGYDETHRSLSPGFVLQYATIGLCHSLDLEAYELLGAADPWKVQLANAARPISRLIGYRRTPLGFTRHRLRKARPLAKSVRARATGLRARPAGGT